MQSTNKLSVAKLDFIEGQEVEWQELFEGFSSIKVITYSSSKEIVMKKSTFFFCSTFKMNHLNVTLEK